MDTMPQDPSNWQSVFIAVAAFSRTYRRLTTCWYLSGVCALCSSRDISVFQFFSNDFVQYLKNYIAHKHLIPACSQVPVDSTDINTVETSSCSETTQQEMTNFTVQLSIR